MSIFDDDPTTMSTMLSNEGFGVMDAPMAGSLLPSFSSAMSWPESFEESMEVAWYQWDPHYQPHADEDEHQSSMRKMKEAAAFNEWVQRGPKSSHAQGAADRADGSSDKADSFIRKTQAHGGGGGQTNTWDERLPLEIPGTNGVRIPGAAISASVVGIVRGPAIAGVGISRWNVIGITGSGTGNPGTEETQEDETQEDEQQRGSDDRVPGERLNPPKVPASFPDDSDTDTGGRLGWLNGMANRLNNLRDAMSDMTNQLGNLRDSVSDGIRNLVGRLTGRGRMNASPPEVPASSPGTMNEYTDIRGQTIGTFDGKHVRIRDIARGMGYDPYSEPGTTLTADFDDHLAWKSDTPGIDYITDQPVRAPRAGLLTYEDWGDSDYGFHGKILHVDEKDGTYATTTFGHLKRPENADDLIRQPETFVEAGEVIGEMGNTGGVETTDGGTQEVAPVTPEQRARGLGAHVHHDRFQASRGGFVDPRGENDD